MAVIINKLNGMTDASYSNVKDTFPESVVGVGTISSVNGLNTRIIGVGTSFLTAAKKGDYVWFKGNDELREIESVCDDLTLTIKFPVDVTATGDTFGIVPRNGYRAISWGVDSTAGADINGISYEASMSRSIGNSKPNGEGGGSRIAPLLIDSTVNGNIVFVSAE
tara:strand:+ start:523 stop:1017 length:495 start_codon:yes stop_codon:yes gene_type:complete